MKIGQDKGPETETEAEAKGRLPLDFIAVAWFLELS